MKTCPGSTTNNTELCAKANLASYPTLPCDYVIFTGSSDQFLNFTSQDYVSLKPQFSTDFQVQKYGQSAQKSHSIQGNSIPYYETSNVTGYHRGPTWKLQTGYDHRIIVLRAISHICVYWSTLSVRDIVFFIALFLCWHLGIILIP